MGTDNFDIIFNQVDLLCKAGLTFQTAVNNKFIPPTDIDCMVDQDKFCIWAENEQPGFAGDLPSDPAWVSPAVFRIPAGSKGKI